MRKLKFLTNKEYVERHYPKLIDNELMGGVRGCPYNIGLERSLPNDCLCQCEYCWNNYKAIKNDKYQAVIERK